MHTLLPRGKVGRQIRKGWLKQYRNLWPTSDGCNVIGWRSTVPLFRRMAAGGAVQHQN